MLLRSSKAPPQPSTAPPQFSNVGKLKLHLPTLLFEQEKWDPPDVPILSSKPPQPTMAPPQLSNVEKPKLPPPTLDHRHLLRLTLEDFHLLEASQSELMFSNLTEVPQIPTAPPHHLWVQLLPQQAKPDVPIDTEMPSKPNSRWVGGRNKGFDVQVGTRTKRISIDCLKVAHVAPRDGKVAGSPRRGRPPGSATNDRPFKNPWGERGTTAAAAASAPD